MQPYAKQIAVEGVQLGLTESEILRIVRDEFEKIEEARWANLP